MSGSVDDPRWPGATRDDLLGRRARRRTAGEVDEASVTMDGESFTVPELPALDDGTYLLDPDRSGPRARRRAVLGSLHGIALDHALSAGGDVVWVDAQGHATTRTFARVAPAERALDRVHVARAFTADQHHALVEQVARWLRDGADGPFGTPGTDRPSIVVCPALDATYHGSDLPDDDATALLSRAVACLAGVARDRDVPVLLTRARRGARTAMIDRAATTVELSRTPFGPRFDGDEVAFETLAYPVDEGVVQTTFAFWHGVLSARHPELVGGTRSDAGRAAAIPGGGGV